MYYCFFCVFGQAVERAQVEYFIPPRLLLDRYILQRLSLSLARSLVAVHFLSFLYFFFFLFVRVFVCVYSKLPKFRFWKLRKFTVSASEWMPKWRAFAHLSVYIVGLYRVSTPFYSDCLVRQAIQCHAHKQHNPIISKAMALSVAGYSTRSCDIRC